MNSQNQHESETSNETCAESPPDIFAVHKYLIYGLSLPERTLRSTAAMVGGVLNESAALLVPQAFRDSKSYRTFIQQMLDMLSNDVGGVEKKANQTGEDPQQVEDYVARKAVGSFVDMAGMATLHLSPIVLLAVVSDLAYGSKTYLDELSTELKKEGIIKQDSTIHGAADLLEAVSEVTSEATSAFDTPPISIEGLRATIESTTDNIARIDPTSVLPKSELDQLWSDMQSIAGQEDVSILKLSSALTMYSLNQVETVTQGALTTIMVTGDVFDRHVLDHYRDGLTEISEKGLYPMLLDAAQPYTEAVWENFSTERETITEDLFTGKLVGKVWDGVSGWLGWSSDEEE